MSQNNAAAAQTNDQQNATAEDAGKKAGLSPEQMQFIVNNPQLLQKAVDSAVRKHKIQQAAKYVGIGGAVALIAYGAFRLTRK